MAIKKMNRTPYTHTRLAARLQLYDAVGYEQILAVQPRMCFDALLDMPDETVGLIVKWQILFMLSDASHDIKPVLNGPEEETCYEEIRNLTKKYMLEYGTIRKKVMANTKKQLLSKHVSTPVFEQEYGTVGFNSLKAPEEMPVFDMEDL